MKHTSSGTSLPQASRVVGLAVVATIVVVASAAALILARDIFLILFLSVLFAVFLVHASNIISQRSPVSYRWALGIVVTLLLIVGVAGVSLLGTQVSQQIEKASKNLDESERKLQELIGRYPPISATLRSTPFVRDLISDSRDGDSTPKAESPKSASPQDGVEDSADSNNADQSESSKRLDTPDGGSTSRAQTGEQQAMGTFASNVAKVLGRVFKTTFGLVVNSALIFFVGLFIAISPADYRDGVVVLFPVNRRERTREVMNMIGETLWRWLLGRFGSMLITGVGAAIVLGSFGVPMGITLGLATGILTFIPNIGGFIGFALALLFAIPQGSGVILGVLSGYIALQLVESYVVTPLIQQKQVSLPPALLIATQAVMGVLLGLLGAAVASPMLAAGKKLMEEVYIKDVLEAEGVGTEDGQCVPAE